MKDGNHIVFKFLPYPAGNARRYTVLKSYEELLNLPADIPVGIFAP